MNTKKALKTSLLCWSFITAGVMGLMACGGSTAKPGVETGGETMNISGIARFEGPQHCTAFALDWGQDQAPAYALTSGHCVQNYSDPESVYQVVQNQPGQGQLVFKYDNSTASQQITVPVREVVYSTLNQTDLAVLRLEGTVAQLRAQGIAPLKLQNTPAPALSSVTVVGAPMGQFLKKIQCALGQRTDVTEFTWVWQALQANDCQGVEPGMSGSPVINRLNQEVLGVINTTTQDMVDTVTCYLGSPCEITPWGTAPQPQRAYSVTTDTLSGCFDNGLWDVSQPRCTLPRSGPALTLDGLYSPLQNTLPGRRWQFAGTADANTHIKIVKAGSDSCQNPNGYQNYKDDPQPLIATEEGVYLACLQNETGLTTWPLQVDNTASTLEPRFKVLEANERSTYIELVYAVPEITRFEYTTARSTLACQTARGFQAYWNVPVDLGPRPVVLCTKTFDRAGNESRVWAHVLN